MIAEQARVLVVDDNEDLRQTLALILRRVGYEVHVASDGALAVEKFQEEVFDIVLLDIVMPVMDGIEAFHRIKQMSPGAPVILMTAYYEEEHIQTALAEGAQKALYKPLDIQQTLELVREVTNRPAVLLVDDDTDLCRTMAQAFELEGYRVYAALDGEQALKMIRQSCRVAFVDIRLPSLNGVQTSIKLKEINPGVTIFMMTGYGEEVRELIEEALATSADGCLYKPLRMSQVIQLVKQVEPVAKREAP